MTTPDDLWTIMQTNYKKKFPRDDIGPFVKEIINSWTTRKYYPTVEIRSSLGTLTALVHRNQFIYDRDNNKTKTWIPVTYTTQSTPNDFGIESITFNNDDLFWLTSKSLEHIIPGINRRDFYIVNIQQTGDRKSVV